MGTRAVLAQHLAGRPLRGHRAREMGNEGDDEDEQGAKTEDMMMREGVREPESSGSDLATRKFAQRRTSPKVILTSNQKNQSNLAFFAFAQYVISSSLRRRGSCGAREETKPVEQALPAQRATSVAGWRDAKHLRPVGRLWDDL